MKEETKKKLKKGLKITGCVTGGAILGFISEKIINRNKIIMSKEEYAKEMDDMMALSIKLVDDFAIDKCIKNEGRYLLAVHNDENGNEDGWLIAELAREKPDDLDSIRD